MDFTKKEYWGSLEEYKGLVAPDSQEFSAPPHKQEISGMERRNFLKLMGASMMLATVACSRRPVEKIIPYVNRPEEIVPGIANWYASTCRECSAGCGILVKTREGRPIKVEGNESHPISQGALCARGQAGILNLYDPDRAQGPLAVSRKGEGKPVSWQEVDKAIYDQLAAVSGGEVVVLTGALNSPSTKKLIADFLKVFPSARHVAFESVVPEELSKAGELSYGEAATPRYRFDRARVVVTFGADFLGTWLSPVEFSKDFRKGRQPEKKLMSRLVAVESALSLTGTNADEHVAVRSGDELPVALALAHEIILNNRQSALATDAVVANALSAYSPAAVAKQTGVPEKTIKNMAANLVHNKGRGLVLGGTVKSKDALALQIVANLLNTVLENDGATVDGSVSVSHQAASSYADLLDLVAGMQQGRVKALILYKTNPVYHLPAAVGFTEALQKVPLVVSCADRLDETAKLSDYLCPDHAAFENWGDAEPQAGLFSLVQPTLSPLYKTRAFEESLIAWAGDLDHGWWVETAGMPSKDTTTPGTWHDYLVANWEKNVARGIANFSTFWEETLKKGVYDTRDNDRVHAERVGSVRSFNSRSLEKLPQSVGAVGSDLNLTLYPSVSLYDGRGANNTWLQELPDPISKITWGNYLAVAPKTATRLGFQESDVVRVSAGNMQVDLPVHIQPMLHEKTVMAAIGYGREAAGLVGNGVGRQALILQNKGIDLPEWSGQVVTLAKTGVIDKVATTQGHHTLDKRGHDIIRETSLAAMAGLHHEEEELTNLWPAHEYKGYRWGMAIDMSACTGCNACMVGCQAENNILPVGKEQVIIGREMHWIRIDRYYSGDADHPQITYQPMLCQQCENAPCETVCPVLATVHNDEGLNQMIYNRCVGTRYCANNCPYKVRRFNYFGFDEGFYKDSETSALRRQPMNLQLNPDISVRSQGVMEKCTFCMQRIRDAKDLAKDAGRRVQDGEIRTACQQTCPSNAIVFGDINDPNSRVSQLKRLNRGYHVLEETNVKPQITYLMKVRNSEEKA